MNLALPAIAAFLILFISFFYHFYGKWIARQFQLDDTRTTPAHRQHDGIDFVPTSKFYLFAQHFSAIAAAGPIAGPIVACQAFGWMPCLLWISMGVVLIGAVHDFSSLTASVRHGACSIAEVTKTYLGVPAGKVMMIFIWLALIYVIVAFSDITAGSFVAAIEELQGVAVSFNPGGAVAAASVMFLILSLILGLVQRFFKVPLWILSLIFVPLVFLTCWAGTLVSHYFVMDVKSWGLLIIAYCGVASLLPVWLLLQPRGYLGGFVLYASLFIGFMGIFFGGYEIHYPAFLGFTQASTGQTLFPFLFVTIACGACSGFHGLVCSGTTAKQVDRESHMHSVGYGAMLAEGLVAVLALMIIMMMDPSETQNLKPGTIYGYGLGRFLTLILGPEHLPFAITFGAMAFSTFVFDTLDVATRLGRYLVQELLQWKGWKGSVGGTLATLSVPFFILFTANEGMWAKFWTLFGSANQLLAGLTLLTLSMWLYQARQRLFYTFLPMIFVLLITLTSLGQLTLSNWQTSQGFDVYLINSFCSLSLIVLALFLIVTATIKVLQTRRERKNEGIVSSVL